ncbi:TPA: YlcG family protein [Escherichia coli]|nr:YlcG family protein [Escherichia coli]EHN2281854.1 YlcG family protein [Shigella sonnei]EJV4782026.1 YlcG family protein [Shigella dysenteriae]AUJ94921.1 hypothetical protein CR539_05530 [Escherichia coli]EFB5146840.1 YlcG family protein [Escherichia coli]EFH5329424.1 YlcG family protein [Escherichia coli]
MMFESYMAERLRRRWVRLHLYHFPGSVLTDYRILKNYAKTLTGAGV